MADDDRLPNYSELLKDLQGMRFDEIEERRRFERIEDRFDVTVFEKNITPFYETPFLGELDPGVVVMFEGKEFILSAGPEKFEPRPDYLYHGTSLEALDLILEQGTMRTAADLHRNRELVWGEMKRDMDREGNYDIEGLKYINAEAFEKLGIELTEEDKRVLGHAYAVMFANHPSETHGYVPEDPAQRAIIGLRQSTLERSGYTPVDLGGSEGIKVEGNITIKHPLGMLFVPAERVEEYEDRIRGTYTARVHPLGDLEWD